ncbi:MAG: FG-GAP repeat domain-containing protein [Armatimonadota bacterium]
MARYLTVFALAGSAMVMAGVQAQEPTGNLWTNPSFEEGMTEREPYGVPNGWSLYAGESPQSRLELVGPGYESDHALAIIDDDPTTEIGIYQDAPAKGGIAYEASAMVKALEDGGGAGAYIQLRFSPSGEYRQVGLEAATTDRFRRVAVVGLAPEDTTQVRVYYYTHKGPTPKLIIDHVQLIGGVPPPPPPPPEPVPPVYEQLKDLHLQTDLVRGGEAQVTIVAPERYQAQSEAIARAIEAITGVRPAVVRDDDRVAAVPPDTGHLDRNFICLGNRSTNAMIEELYNRFYTLLDLKYPGPGGYEVRTCHNPFGDGHNIIFVGGSDDAGVEEAAQWLVGALRNAGGQRGELTIGRLMEIETDLRFPHNPAEIEIWDASRGYGSTGYFGWVSHSKHLAAYYMTGDEFHAREFIRLAFPDEEAKRQITEIDGERIENKDDPLAGPYHYNAHMMILFWDLVEESPVFTDEERLAVTNAFSRQLDWRKGEGVYGLTEPPNSVSSRHGQWSAVSLYCLSRYFAKDYGDQVWRQGMIGSLNAFRPLESHAWVHGEADNLFWYNTGHAPILAFMMLSGWRGAQESGVLGELLRGQEILATGKNNDWDLNTAAITFLHQAAYLTGDGRWLEYRNRTGVDLTVPRVGQSFWPEPELQPELPLDMVGHWSIHPMPRPMWALRGTGFPLDHSFQFGSFRSTPGADGDFILIDGYNGASRNPYHTFAILEMRLDGATLLKGYRNQVLTRVDGMVEPQIAMDGALRDRDVVGDVAMCVGEVPHAAYCNWRRTLAQRVGRYALVVDELTMRESSDNIQVQMLWEVPSGQWDSDLGGIGVSSVGGPYTPVGWTSVRALSSGYESEPAGEEHVAALDSLGIRLLRATEPGQWLEMVFTLDNALEGQVYADFLRYTDRGVFAISLDGQRLIDRWDSWAAVAEPARVDLGHHRLAAGEHRLRVEVVERGQSGTASYIGLMGLSIRPDDAPPAQQVGVRHAILASDPVRALREGSVHTLEWVGPGREGERLTFFSLVGAEPVPSDEHLACLRIADNAAALGLPQPAVAVAGEYQGTSAELAIIARDHLYAQGATAVAADAPLLSATEPVKVMWDYAAGTVAVHAPKDTALSLRAQADGLALDGRPAQVEVGEQGLVMMALPAGEHQIAGARLADAGLEAWLGERRAEGARMRAAAAAQEPPGTLPDVPELQVAMSAKVGEGVREVITIPDGAGGELIVEAGGTTITFLRPDGAEAATAKTDGDIRDITWWPEHELLIAGCADEQVIAFNRAGQRQWVFVSEMDPAVFRAAKDYWFKSAPAHAGIWGVHTGVFLNGESQLFVGSACTLEILDENGRLVHRMPQFWGDPHVLQIIDGPDGSLNLLAARRINGNDTLGIINNRTLDPTPRGFHTVPAGHTYVGGWASMNRYHIFYEDLDGDGTREVISEKNGSWNRVTVWDQTGTPLYDASFGPGANSPTRNMRDLVVADLDGDGTMEVVAATSSGLVVALDHRLVKEWARALPSAPNVMTDVAAPGGTGRWLVAACDDGTVVALDAQGQVVRIGRVEGRPGDEAIAVLATADGPAVAVGTASGEVAVLLLR